MKIKKLQIKNFKSIVDLELINPNPFSVFVGPNASGKSNIFEAIQFFVTSSKSSLIEPLRKFGGINSIRNYNSIGDSHFEIMFNDFESYLIMTYDESGTEVIPETSNLEFYRNILNDKINIEREEYTAFFKNNHRYFINNERIVNTSYQDDSRLNTSCSNLEKVLKRILHDEIKREEISEWIQLFIPGFEKVEIVSESLSGSDNLLIYEKGTKKPFNKSLISDGTYNILCLLTACYQSDEPQFLCIEEPENGLNPFVVRELVNLFRDRCDEGHYIWVNTHSQSLVGELKEEEIILVDKKDGETKIKQIQPGKSYGLRMDEALFTNLLGGGIPW
ncbi:MAG: AAA family ATPase [Bacteroidia bacterium]